MKNFSLVLESTALINNWSLEKAKEFKEQYPQDTICGFFHANKTDVLFKKIKNKVRDDRHERYLGQILSIEKPHVMAVEMARTETCHLDQELMLKTPEGKEIKFKARFIKDAFGAEKSDLLTGELGLLPFVKGAQPKSLLYSI